MRRFSGGGLVPCIALLILWLAGCKSEKVPFSKGLSWDNLVDTLYSGERSRFFLTDGNGGWFIDDDESSGEFTHYGLHYFDQHLLWGWNVQTPTGENLRQDLRFTLVHPFFVERHWGTGLVERVEPAWKQQGLLVIWRLSHPQDVVITIFATPSSSSFRSLQTLPQHLSYRFKPSPSQNSVHPPVLFSPVKSLGKESWDLIRCEKVEEFIFPESRHIELALCYDRDDSEASGKTEFLLSRRGKLLARVQDEFTRWQRSFLFITSDPDLNRLWEWCRVSLLKLIVEKNDGRAFILSGLPHTPYEDICQTSLLLPTLALLTGSVDLPERLLRTILSNSRVRDGEQSLPTYLTPDSALYLTSLSSAFCAISEQNLIELGYPLSPEADSLLFNACYRQTVSILKKGRWVGGLWDGGTQIPIGSSFDSARTGATIESQFLFSFLRQWVKFHKLFYHFADSLPNPILSGGSSWTNPFLPPVGFSTYGPLPIPLSERELRRYFHYKLGQLWFDRVMLDSEMVAIAHQKGTFTFPVDTSWSVYIPLLHSCLYPEDKEMAREIVERGERAQALTELGFRIHSISGSSAFNSLEEAGDKDNGDGVEEEEDILVWSMGALGGMFHLLEQYERLDNILQTVQTQLLSGTWGALPEVVSGESVSPPYSVKINEVCALSCAQFLALIGKYYFGVVRGKEGFQQVKVRIPQAWLPGAFQWKRGGFTFKMKKTEPMVWFIRIEGEGEPFDFVLEEIVPPRIKVTGSVRLLPDQWYIGQVDLSSRYGGSIQFRELE